MELPEAVEREAVAPAGRLAEAQDREAHKEQRQPGLGDWYVIYENALTKIRAKGIK